MFKNIKTLVMMQLKDKIDFGFAKTKKGLISKIVLTILSFVLITAGIYALLLVSQKLHIFSVTNILPVSVIAVVFTIMQLLSIYEIIKNCYFILPLFIAFGIISKLSFVFYIWVFVAIVIISTISVSIASFLSFFTMWISAFLKNYNIVRVILFLGIVGVSIYLIVSLIGKIPENLDIVGSWRTLFWDIQDFLTDFTKTFYPFTMLTSFVVGFPSGLSYKPFSITTLYIFLSVVAFVAVMLALSFLISRPLFFKMSSSPFEYKRVVQEHQLKNKKLPSFMSSIKKEILTIFRTPDDLYNLFGVAIAMPILILLLNKILAAMSTRLLGNYMGISFNLLIIMLISMASSNKIASVYSREGAAGIENKTRPTSYFQTLTAKLITYAVVITISIISSVCIFASYNELATANKIFFAFSAIFVYVNHLLWSAEMDIMNPQNFRYSNMASNISNPNETKSTIAMLVLAGVFTGVSLFLSIENIAVAYLKVMILAIGLLIYRCWSYYTKTKIYYKEK